MADISVNTEKPEDFIRRILKERFGQDVQSEELTAAAQKLNKAIPKVQSKAA